MSFTATGRSETTFTTQTLETETCAMCGILFAIPTSFQKKRREYGDRFYCPNGHHLTYGDSEAVKERQKREACELAAKREKEALERRLRMTEENERIEHEARKRIERRWIGQKGATTRIKKKIAAGRCPCCSHQFKDLERHMKNRHPKWDPDRHAEAIAAQAGAQEAAGATIEGRRDV